MRFNLTIALGISLLSCLTWATNDVNAQFSSGNTGSMGNTGNSSSFGNSSFGNTTQTPSTNFGSLSGSSGQSITNQGNMFSQPLPTAGGTTGGTSSASGGSASAAGGATATNGGAAMMQQNLINPFAAPTAAGQTGSTSLRGSNSFGSGFGAFNSLFNNQAFQSGFGQDDTPKLPTKLTVKFDHPVIPAATVNADITRRIRKVVKFPNVTVSVVDRVATVSGTVASQDDLRLVGRFVVLEPGVSSVVNQVVVQKESPTDQ